MNLGSFCRSGIAGLVLLAAALPAAADVIVLDADDVTDWVRVYSSATWKQKDACLHPNALLKFDLSQIFDPASVISARLDLFAEKVQPGEGIELWHVLDDAWNYAYTEPASLWDWPVDDWIGTRVFDDTTSFSFDVTDHVREESAIAGQEFSVKIVAAGIPYPHLRIASSLAPIERMRPRLVVEFLGPPAPPPIPDLAVSSADLRLFPMRPLPGQGVTIQAGVRNIGAGDAWNVPVAFYDGEPTAGNPPIGIWIIPYLPPGGGWEQTSVLWSAVRGLHEIHVVADFEDAVFETDERNNVAVRPFLIAEDAEYTFARESFEYPGRVLWHADFDVPKQFEYPGPKSFYVNHANGEAYHGEHAIELYLDGTADDGTIWLETAVPVEPGAYYDVQVDFELFRYQPDMAFEPVVAVTLLDPEQEGDFEVLQQPAETGWALHTYREVLYSGPYDMVHVAVGLTCTWETPGTFFIDLIRSAVLPIPPESAPDGAAAGGDPTMLLPGRPNPFRTMATIAYRLNEPGPVSLEVFDVTGRLVSTLREGREEPGFHRVCWNGADRSGRALPSGVYLYRLRTAAGEQSRKLLLER